jgi:hypothetical protein
MDRRLVHVLALAVLPPSAILARYPVRRDLRSPAAL